MISMVLTVRGIHPGPRPQAPTRLNKKALRPAKERMYAIIDHATSETLSAPNFALYTDVAAAITGSAEPQ